MHTVHFALLLVVCPVLSATQFNPSNLPSVVWWTDLLYPHAGSGSAEITCPGGGRCMSSTRRRKYRREKMAFLFYGTDFYGEDLPLPRRDGHMWALLHEESPMNNWLLCHPHGIRLFNLTATFSRHSHFPLSTQHLPSEGYLTRRKPLHTRAKNELRAQGVAPVLYLQSHCGVASDRDRYVGHLMQFLQVDSYGKCLHNYDLPPHLRSTETYHSQELLDFIARYKFHLAFENAICEDYVTEKLFRVFHVGSVPIYRGSPSASDWAPSNMSLVMADDFPSPKELADFIKKLDANDELYDAYLTYKVEGISNEFLKKTLKDRTWSVDDPTDTYRNEMDPTAMDFIRGFECYVCDQLCRGLVPPAVNQRHMNCPPPHASLGPVPPQYLQEEPEKLDYCELRDNSPKSGSSCQVPLSEKPVEEEWSVDEWLEHYQFAAEQAKAIALMLHGGEEDSSRFLHYLDNFAQ